MIDLKIGGVPEHFNLAWYFALRDGKFKNKGINLRWKDFHGGTGQMNKALRAKEIDMAVILTDGIIKDIIAGNKSKIVQIFIQTPLIWGIHVAANSAYTKISDLKDKKPAISRFGSGSHLMAYVNAEKNGWNPSELEFEVINNLDGAIKGLSQGKGDYFMWEHFTTKPLVDNGTFRRLGDCPSPWPCFVIAVREDVLKNNPKAIKTILKIINKYTKRFKKIKDIDLIIAKRYGQQIEDVQQWIDLTEWSQKQIKKKTIVSIQKKLLELNIIPKKIKHKELVHKIK